MKYMGSKSRIKKYIIPILQKIIDNNNIELFVDIFCGGCNIIDSIKCKERVANDIATPLISMWKGLLNGNKLPEEISKELYDDIRSNKNTDKYPDWYIGAVGYLASYNGRYFDGGYAKPVIEKGRIRNYYKEAKNNIEKQLSLLKDVIFTNNDYKNIELLPNSLIYCDIPYQNTKQYLYSKDFNYEEFWNWVRINSKNNIIIVSELQAPDDFVCIWEQEVSRSIKTKDKSKALEKLFIHNSLLDVINKINYNGGCKIEV